MFEPSYFPSGTRGTFQRHCSQSCLYSDDWKQHGVHSGKYSVPLENLKKGHFQDCNFQTVPRHIVKRPFKNLCLWCEFQSCVRFIIGLVLKDFFPALYLERSLTFKTSCIIITVPVHLWLRIFITKLIISSPFIRVRQHCKCIADCCKGEQNIKFYE